jgi:hypothetical protein
MSALGQKQTCAPQNVMSALPPIATAKADMPQMVMSALPPKADMCGAFIHVCFGPEADMRQWSSLLARFFASCDERAVRSGCGRCAPYWKMDRSKIIP